MTDPCPATSRMMNCCECGRRFSRALPIKSMQVAADLTQWRAAIDDHDTYDELVLWFEHDLFDQLNLIQLLSHLGMRPSKPVTMVQIDSYPGHPISRASVN